MKNKKKCGFNLAYLLALVPVASVALYLLLLILTPDTFWEPAGIPILRPIGQQDVSEFSVIGILIIAATVFVWGACGAFAAKKRLGLVKATVISHALPIIATVAYVVMNVITIAGGAESIAESADIATLGFGLFLLLGNYIYQLVALNIIEVFVDLVLMAGTFIVGYCIGASKPEKKK